MNKIIIALGIALASSTAALAQSSKTAACSAMVRRWQAAQNSAPSPLRPDTSLPSVSAAIPEPRLSSHSNGHEPGHFQGD